MALPGPGMYEFQLLTNDQLIATKAIRVSLVDGSELPEAPPDDE